MVGFQSPGTLGRKLVDGAPTVSMFGQKIPVRASIHTMGGFSAHAGQSDLLKWFDSIAPSRPRPIITHGEDDARQIFSDLIREKHGLNPEMPQLGDVIEI
jgi:metallo-beta-lactamase family protein